MGQAEALIEDIETLQEGERLRPPGDGLVRFDRDLQKPSAVHETLAAFEKGLRDNDDNIPPSMIYAYAAIKMGVPYANGAPNLSADVPALDGAVQEDRRRRSAARISRPARR